MLGFTPSSPALRPVGLDSWELQEDLCYTGSTDTWCVPKGTITDFATVPRFLQGLISDTGLWLLAAILHDWLCTTGITTGAVTSRDADGIFRRIMREHGVSFILRWLIWTGVRLGALFNPLRRPGILPDLPLVTLWTVLAAPFVLPPAVLTLLAVGCYKFVHMFCVLFAIK